MNIVQIVRHHDGRIEERTPPRQLPSCSVTVIDVYGELFYAGARTFERLLPVARGADGPAVVLRLRGRDTLDATLMDVLCRYADQIEQANGRLYLTGISDAQYEQVVSSDKLNLRGMVRARRATSFVGESTSKAVADAEGWLAAPGARGDNREQHTP